MIDFTFRAWWTVTDARGTRTVTNVFRVTGPDVTTAHTVVRDAIPHVVSVQHIA